MGVVPPMGIVPLVQGSVLPVAGGREDGAMETTGGGGLSPAGAISTDPRGMPVPEGGGAPVPAAVKLDPAGGVMPLAAQEPMPLGANSTAIEHRRRRLAGRRSHAGTGGSAGGDRARRGCGAARAHALPTELRRTEGDSDGADRRPDIADGGVGRHAGAEGGARADGLGLRRAAYRDQDHEKGQGRRVRFHVHLQDAAGNPQAGAAATRELAIRRRREHPPAARRPP